MKTIFALCSIIIASALMYGCGSDDSTSTKQDNKKTPAAKSDKPAANIPPADKASYDTPAELVIAHDAAYRAKDYETLCALSGTELVAEMLQDAKDNEEPSTCPKMLEINMNSEEMFSGDTMYNITTSNPAITAENINQLDVQEDGDTAEANFEYTDDEGTDTSVSFSLIKEANGWKMNQ